MAARRLTRESVLRCEDCGSRHDLAAGLDELDLRSAVRAFVAEHAGCDGFTLDLRGGDPTDR